MEENKHVTGVLDNLNTPSIPEKQPLFQLANFFKPTAKNVTILGLVMRSSAITICASAFATQNLWIFVAGIAIGGLGEAIVLFSKEEPISTIIRASEDHLLEEAKNNPTQSIENVSL